MLKFGAVIVLVWLAAAFWGIGVAVQRVGNRPSSGQPTSIGIGLSVLIFIGGILNLAHLAYRPALWILASAGLLLSALELRRARFPIRNPLTGRGEVVAAGMVIAAATIFALSTQLPPREFNFHDDLQKYFSHPVRMLATGTLAGSPLSALGSETLGAQAFLHGFVLSVLPIGYINGVDAVLGFSLLMLLAAWAGRGRFPGFAGAALGPLLVAVINPQFVNVSGLYLGSLLMATAVVLVATDREPLPTPFILGLLYAAMVSLKTTFALFPLIHLPLAAWALRGTLGSAKQTGQWTARVLLWTLVGLLPWVLLYLPNYLAYRRAASTTPVGNNGPLSLFSSRPLFYGATFLDYTLVVLFAAILACLALLSMRKSSNCEQTRRSLGVLGGAATGALSFLIVVIGLGPALNGYETNLRYAIPFLLGACVISIVMAPAACETLPRWLGVRLPWVVSLLLAAAFLPSLWARDRQAVQFGSILAFSPLAESPAYQNYNQFALSAAARQQVTGFQGQVPAGATLLAWINTPFFLDYKRNVIMDADTTGISSPWARVPANVQYILWQYKGYGVRSEGDYVEAIRGPGQHERTIAVRSLAFGDYLAKLAESSQVIASDGQFVLFKLPQASHN